MKALVTGGAGFIGSHVVDMLIDVGIETRVLVSGFRSSKHPSIVNKDAQIIKGDLRDYSRLVEATRNIDMVFHLGGVFSHYCDMFPELAIGVNIIGTFNIKRACAINKVDRIIYASSSFVYGEPKTVPVKEDNPKIPKDLLGTTKLAAEAVLQSPDPNTVKYTILRLFNVYGPRQYPDNLYTSVISTWINRALKGEPLEIHDNGTQHLDFVYVSDVANAFIMAMDKSAENKIYNVGSGNSISINELAIEVNSITGNKAPLYYNRSHPMFLKYVRADIRKIRSELCWQPQVSIENGLYKTVKFFMDKSNIQGTG